jgi:PAS domain-containing protein
MDPAQTTGASPPPELLELAELRSQLARYRAAFELSVPGQALIGLTGRFLEANASLCQILGYSQAELQSRRFRYITRPAISEQRLSISPQGRVRYQLKTPWRNGTTHVEWDAVDFIAKLAALDPPPRAQALPELRRVQRPLLGGSDRNVADKGYLFSSSDVTSE